MRIPLHLPALQVLRDGPTSLATVSRYLGQVPWSSLLRYVRIEPAGELVSLTTAGREQLALWEADTGPRLLPWSTVMLAANACARARTGARLAELGRAAVVACETLGCVRDGLLTSVGVLFSESRTLAGSESISPEIVYARFWLTVLHVHGASAVVHLAALVGCSETAVMNATHWLSCARLVSVTGSAEYRLVSITPLGRVWLSQFGAVRIPASEDSALCGVAA